MESESKGWIKAYRKFTQWRWFKTPNMYHLFSYFLMTANREDGEWEGIKINRGQFITGIRSLSQNTGISAQSIRTCITRLKSTGEITIKSTNKYSIITISKYDQYQDRNSDTNNQTNNQTNKRLTNDQQTTNNKQEEEEVKEVKEKEILKENFLSKEELEEIEFKKEHPNISKEEWDYQEKKDEEVRKMLLAGDEEGE